MWVLNGTAIAPVAATAGLSDSTYTELVGSPIGEGALVVIRSSAPGTAPAARTASTAPGNPLICQVRVPASAREVSAAGRS